MRFSTSGSRRRKAEDSAGAMLERDLGCEESASIGSARPWLRRASAAVLSAMVLALPVARPAAAYPIDCAILLCLAGGFPASEPCAKAHAEMIRRITPWPIEPPLQLWRCPMRSKGTRQTTPPGVFDVRYIPPRLSALTTPLTVIPVPIFGETPDDYVRSIRVYHLRYTRRENARSGACVETGQLDIGSYDAALQFDWTSRSYRDAPRWMLDRSGTDCSMVRYRGVAIEWRDAEGRERMENILY